MSDPESSDNPKPLEVDPIPQAGISEILGLLEILDDRKGKDKIYTLARDLNFDFGNLLCIVKAAEMLELLYTPGTDVVIKALGKKVIETDMNEKKKIILTQLRKLTLFQFVKRLLSEQDEKKMSKEKFLETLSQVLPKERPEQLFDIIIGWGRWGEFLGYSQDDGFVYLDQG